MQASQTKTGFFNFPARFHNIFYDRDKNFDVPYLREFISSTGQKKYKLSVMKCVNNKLVEKPNTKKQERNKNTEKLDNNLSRAKSLIYEYAFCNPWQFFITLTLDKTKTSREDLKYFQARFQSFVKWFNRKYSCSLFYLLIPELHQDLKSWHFHGFIGGIPADRIKEFKIGDKMRS